MNSGATDNQASCLPMVILNGNNLPNYPLPPNSFGGDQQNRIGGYLIQPHYSGGEPFILAVIKYSNHGGFLNPPGFLRCGLNRKAVFGEIRQVS